MNRFVRSSRKSLLIIALIMFFACDSIQPAGTTTLNAINSELAFKGKWLINKRGVVDTVEVTTSACCCRFDGFQYDAKWTLDSAFITSIEEDDTQFDTIRLRFTDTVTFKGSYSRRGRGHADTAYSKGIFDGSLITRYIL